MTEKDYCDYDTCVALRELGYNAPQRLLIDYFGVYDEPQYDERIHLYDAQKWLREEKKIEVNATSDLISDHQWFWEHKSLTNMNSDVSYPYYKTYEEALLEGVREAIKLLKKEK